MKHVFLLLFLFASITSLQAQVSETTGIRLYRVNDHLVKTEADGSNPISYPFANVQVHAANDLIEVSITSAATLYYTPSLFLNDQGVPYGSTVNSAVSTFLQTIPGTSATGSSGTAVTTDASLLTSGTLDDARLSANVVKTTGSYSNPTWLNALDPTRITQSSLHRFVSDSEKEAWNNKPDLTQVRSVVKDSLRTYTFVNAGVVTNGSSTTVTIPTGSGGASMPVDSVLSSTSPNAIANAAVTKAINQANASVATNTTAISQANANIATNTTAIATNTAAIATNAASITALQTQLTSVTAQSGPVDDARLSANVVKTTGSYSNPTWLNALDPTRITQSSLHRFVSDSEKEAWNNKPDLTQVRSVVKDSLRTYTFVNAGVVTNGSSTTVTIPTGSGGASMPVDSVLSSTSPNAIANAAVTKAINQANASVATNTTAISQANANIATNTTAIATNTAAIATNAASITALQTQLTSVTAQSGPVDDARLSANVVKTTGSYSNPTWLNALDPTRITQSSLHRFVSDSEKEAWNNKPDLTQVRSAIKDSLRTYTFVNAGVVTNGSSTTVTIPTGSGGASMPVDSVLSSTSPNAIANAAVTKAINQANASVATNITAISQANANIATNTAAIATNTTAIATNTAAITTNAASITALQTQVTAATATLSGPVDDARLSANVVKTTGTYSNPGWISAFDPSRITQTSLYRFVSDSEKETWNNKTDLSQVRLAIKDSVRAITFVNAVVTSNGNSLTVTIPNGGTNGSSVTVDNALSPTSTNPLTNAAINAAFNQVNNNMAANTAGIATNTTAINQINATISNLSNTVAANTATVTSSAASVTALQTQLAITMAQVASLSALVGQLQEQIAVSSGTYTISTPTLTASISSNTSILLSWGASTNATSYTLESATNSGFTENLTMLSVLSGTSYTATGLTAGITYYFRIKASGGSNTSPSGYGTVSATISTVQPTLSAPTNVVASVISSSAINVSWTASPNATGYSVRYATNSSMNSATIITTSNNVIDLTGLTPGTSYFIDVSASAAGFTQSATSAIVTATTSAPVPTLATPTNIVASATSESAITVSWTGTLNATGYSVRYALTSDMTSATTVTTAINSVTLTGLAPVTTYFIDVSAMASGFTPSAASPTVAATTGAPTPTLTAPTNVAASPASPSTINVSWTASPNATGYSVRYATNSNMTSATTVTSSTNSITLTELAPATTYFINVSANASGYNSSDASAVVTATTGQTPVTLAAPTNVVASPQSTSTIAVSWTASANATSYSVRYATNSSMTSATTVTTTTTSTILTGLKPSTFYFIDVSAMASGFTSSTPATTTAGTPDAAVALAAPTNVVASPQSTSAITVSWTGSASATGYSVRYATNSSMTSATTVTTTATNTTLTGLKSSTSYFIDVSATAPGFTTSVPTSATARTNDAPVTLPTPTNVVASAQSTSTIAVSWTGSTSATSYSVRYATSSSMTSATTITTTTTSTALTDLAAGTLYFVDISASAPGFVTSATSATASARTIGNLAIPANVVATALGGSAIGVSWTASPNATSYSVRYALTSDMTSATTVTTAATSTTITGLTTLTAYFVDVSASASGYITSATSPVSSATTTAAFVAERTFRLAFQGATSGVATAGWNQIKPTAAQITSPNSYTSGMLLTESGASSTIFVTLESPYTQATASSFTATAGSIYPQTVMQSAWQVTSANLAGGRYSINGLTPGKYYQLYFLSATTIASNATVSYTINGVVKTINAGFNSGVGGGAEFAPNKALVTYFNVQPDANGRITVSNKYVSGTVSPFTTCVIRESSVPL